MCVAKQKSAKKGNVSYSVPMDSSLVTALALIPRSTMIIVASARTSARPGRGVMKASAHNKSLVIAAKPRVAQIALI